MHRDLPFASLNLIVDKVQTAEPIAEQMMLRGVRRAPAQAASRDTRSDGTGGQSIGPAGLRAASD
jgi:hypothetical protein